MLNTTMDLQKSSLLYNSGSSGLISPSPPLPSACLPSPHPFSGLNCNFGVKTTLAKGKEKSLNIVHLGNTWHLWVRNLLIDLAGVSIQALIF